MATASSPKPPTNSMGYQSELLVMGFTHVDSLENVSALSWPTSVATYARMRTDPRLTAVLNAYTLPLRAAPKYVDPAGCKSEVVQLIADDLGLEVLGKENGPGPARRRGVDFSEHFRLACLSLVFGHMCFEQQYEIKNNQARLVKLSERMPSTLTDILTNDDGELDGVLQFGGKDVIPANRLVWYAHEREGSAWQGRSMLRAAYAPWLLKHEMMRVHAAANRRFGMGVPNVEAPAGATPGQVEEAARLASQIRGGDSAGVGLPAGFKLNLSGITGGTPDTLAYIRYFDSQMAEMALASVLNLDYSPNGSRALGDTFIDLMLTSLNAIAGEMSQVLTKLAVQMVDYNFGEDENVPRVVVGDVGSRPEVTAEALVQLMSAGALKPDPELETWVRERWSLPEKDPNAPLAGMPIDVGGDPNAPTPPVPDQGGQPAPGQTPPTQPGGTAQAGARVYATKQARYDRLRRQTAASAGYRQLTTVEATSGMIPEQIQGDWEGALSVLVRRWKRMEASARAKLMEQVTAAVDSNDATALSKLSLDYGVPAEELAGFMADLAGQSMERVIEEASTQGVHLDPAEPDTDHLKGVATAVASIVAAGTSNAAGREALRVWTPGRDGAAVASMVGAHLGSFSDTWLRDQLGGALSAAQNAGRFAALLNGPTPELYASEVLDRNTCDNCRAIDGYQFRSDTEAQNAYAAGGYVECLGRLRCRGIVVALWSPLT